MSTLASHLRHISHHNLLTLRTSPFSELSGSLGDLGTLLPLLIALTLQGSISFSSTLVFSGLTNIFTGVYYGIPLPVQPMKAIAAVALTSNLSREETAGAGMFVGAAVLVGSVTGVLGVLERVVPLPVIRGIQLSAGLSLIMSAGTSLLRPLDWVSPVWDNYLLTLLAFLGLFFSSHRPAIPFALVVTLLGIVLSALALPSSRTGPNGPWIWHPTTLVPSGDAFLKGTLQAGLPQLPLTTLNSILAVSSLAHALHLDVPSPKSLGISVGLANLIAPWFGGMPVCHGSGGLAGQYRFGARSGASVIILGTVKLMLGLLVGDRAVGVLRGFPRSLLGVMVVAAGVELARVGGDVEGDEEKLGRKEKGTRWEAVLVTVAGALAFKNEGVGFLVGMIWWWGGMRMERWNSRGVVEREPLLGERI
ncbi:hypothetical protein KVT40_006858 [Elsinoe batatas]|uniref:Molybdate transporter 1 n=1 Tax=Elsinoe batatas TaxID=2601811 RepID=A0A8K0KX20_9PEZI|nr:hypothetical protein KVT40_006858 [Elsinoe batatas]